ncbi:helix-hairpin-helix domain-containing protein [Trueperella pyogenes]
MKEPSPRRTAMHRPPHGGRPNWAKVDSFIRTAMRMGAGDDIGALTSSAKKRRFVLDGRSLRLAAILLLVLALSGAIAAISQRSEVVAIPPTHIAATSAGASAEPAPSTSEQPSASARAKSTPSAAASAAIVIHVSGAVGAPGVVSVTAPARVNDAITAAGGAAENADLSRINLAQPIEDGAHIHVPSEGEPVAGSGAGTAQDSGSSSDAHPRGAKVNINTADQTTLQKVPGIGPVTAKAIIAWRTNNGSFSSVDQLIDVTGIGPKTLEQLREHVCV